MTETCQNWSKFDWISSRR